MGSVLTMSVFAILLLADQTAECRVHSQNHSLCLTFLGIIVMNNFQNFIMVPVNAGNYRWYAIDVTDEFTQLRIEMTHIGTIGDPDLYGQKKFGRFSSWFRYVRFGATPDNRNYDFADLTIRDTHVVAISRNDPVKPLQNGRYYFAVFAFGQVVRFR